MITVGIDVGSITTKAALVVDNELNIARIRWTGYDAQAAASRIFYQILKDAGLEAEHVDYIVSTGYGRKSVSFADTSVTEITCHATGANFVNPAIRSVIDIGGQDSKAIVLDEKGRVKDFAMNDKCAAGTGRFLEVMARALEVDLEKFGEMSLQAMKPSKISSLCTVFAESEVISLIAKGEMRNNIIAGIHDAIGARVTAMAEHIGIIEPVMMTGGVAKNIGLVKALEKRLNKTILVSKTAQMTGAIGAALIASRSA